MSRYLPGVPAHPHHYEPPTFGWGHSAQRMGFDPATSHSRQREKQPKSFVWYHVVPPVADPEHYTTHLTHLQQYSEDWRRRGPPPVHVDFPGAIQDLNRDQLR